MNDLDRQIAKLKGLQPVSQAFLERAKDWLKAKGLPITSALQDATHYEDLPEGAFRLFESRHLDWSVNEQRMMALVEGVLAKPADGLLPWFFFVSYAARAWKAQFFLMDITKPGRVTYKFTGAHVERLQAVGQAWIAAKEWQIKEGKV